MQHSSYSNNPQRAYLQSDLLGVGLFEGRAYLRGGLVQSLAFSSNIDIQKTT